MNVVWIIIGSILLLLSISQIFGTKKAGAEGGTLHEETVFFLIHIPFLVGTSLITFQSAWALLIIPAALLFCFIVVPFMIPSFLLTLSLIPKLYAIFPILIGATIGLKISESWFDSERNIIVAIICAIIALTYCSLTRKYAFRIIGNQFGY